MAPWLPPAMGGRRSRVFSREVVTLGRGCETGSLELRSGEGGTGWDRVGRGGNRPPTE